MSAILLSTLPIWLMILVGYVAVKSGYFDGSQIGALGQFTLKVALIALIVQAIALPREGVLNLPFMVAYALAALATMVIGYAALRVLLGRSAVEGWVLAMGMGNSNSGFLGLPIAVLIFGEAGAQVFAMTMTVENALTLPFAIVAAGAASGQAGSLRTLVGQAVRRVATNPLIVAVVLSLVWRASGLTLPQPAVRSVTAIAAAALPVALFVIGGTVAGLRTGKDAPQAAAVAFGKLALHPALAALALALVPGVPPHLIPVGILFAAVPMLTIYPILAAPFGLSGVASTALISTTAASLVSVSAILALIAPG